jgi:hypothetical protein
MFVLNSSLFLAKGIEAGGAPGALVSLLLPAMRPAAIAAFCAKKRPFPFFLPLSETHCWYFPGLKEEG